MVDHHCHGVLTEDLDRAGFEALLNEGNGAGALGTTVFDSMLGLAVRRWCAPVLGLEPLADAQAYLARRTELGAEEVNNRFVSASATADFVVDTGFGAGRVTGAERTAAYAGGRGHEIVRLEAVAEELLESGTTPADFAERLREQLTGRGAVGAKSIAAYRTGLALAAGKPTDDTLVAALGECGRDADGTIRLAHPVVHAWLAHTAVEEGLPLQIHVGYGDNDVDLADCDPLRLTAFLRATQDRGTPVLLLHNYPFHRHAAYLAQVFSHVFMDVGLATHNTGALSTALVRESLELVPFAKMLYSSDAFGLAELYHLGSLLFRRSMSEVLAGLVDADEMGETDAERVVDLVAHDNARRVYAL
ncbi:MAG: amidohydrolase family protein [Nocardioidaceae bacterium]|nr:amidohydrolase family protein [Nocardioidaceae bacterium]